MTTVIFVLVAFSVLMPVCYIVRLLRLDAESKSAWLMVAIEGMTFVALTALVARWDIAGYHVRTVIIVGFLVALAWSFRAHASRPWGHPDGLLRQHKPTLVALILFLAALAYVLTGVSPPAGTRQLALPVDAERVIAGQAGRIAVLTGAI